MEVMKGIHMVSLLAMTGSASLAGAWVYKRLGNKEQEGRDDSTGQAWWKTPWQTVQKILHQTEQRASQSNPLSPIKPLVDDSSLVFIGHADDATNAAIQYGLRTSTLALGVTTAGWLVCPSLQIVGLPLLVYLGIPPAQAAYNQLWVNGRPSRALAETVVLAVCLTSGCYWVGSLGFWLYYGSRTLLANQQQSVEPRQLVWLAPTTAHRWQDGAVCVVTTTTLQPGDQVILQSGEQAPVDGLITEGVAWLRAQASSATASGQRKAIGDRVAAADLVLVGRICVRVLATV